VNSQTAHLDKEHQDFLKKLGKNITEVRRKKKNESLKIVRTFWSTYTVLTRC